MREGDEYIQGDDVYMKRECCFASWLDTRTKARNTASAKRASLFWNFNNPGLAPASELRMPATTGWKNPPCLPRARCYREPASRREKYILSLSLNPLSFFFFLFLTANVLLITHCIQYFFFLPNTFIYLFPFFVFFCFFFLFYSFCDGLS